MFGQAVWSRLGAGPAQEGFSKPIFVEVHLVAGLSKIRLLKSTSLKEVRAGPKLFFSTVKYEELNLERPLSHFV